MAPGRRGAAFLDEHEQILAAHPERGGAGVAVALAQLQAERVLIERERAREV